MEKSTVLITPYFKWFDFWMGIFFDRATKTIYIGILPMVGIKIQLGVHAKQN